MSYHQKTPMLHCAATIMHSKPWNKMRNRTAAIAGRGDGNKVGLAHAEAKRKAPFKNKIEGMSHEELKEAGGKAYDIHMRDHDKGTFVDGPLNKQKGGGTTKTCLPAAKLRNMSKEEREKLVNSKRAAGAKGKYKRSSRTNVKGARKKGATLRDWFEKEDWRRVDDPSKKCGE
tara:strand:+ start:268 stop:786 length:519 start_codon:yes stop_codon:yes gene_type:complete